MKEGRGFRITSTLYNYVCLLGHNKSLDEFTYEDADINQMIFECVSNTSMKGVSGNVEFHNGPDPIKKVKIEQIQGIIRPY